MKKEIEEVIDENEVRDEEELRRRRKGLDPTPDENPDLITGEPGSHPVGVATGGAGGAAAGAAVGGAVGGPVGAVAGGIVGAVGGGLVGKAAAEAVNPTDENRYWRENYKTRPYYRDGSTYEEYEPAYRYGWESAMRPEYQGRSFEDVESQLQTEWPQYSSTPGRWEKTREASRDAYDRASSRISRAKEEAAEDSDSVWHQVKGNWKQFKGYIKEKWNMLTDDEIEEMEGRRERIIGKIQERYGEAKWKANDIEDQLRGVDRRD